MEKINDAVPIPEVQLVVFRLKDEEFGLNILEVREIVRMMEITHIPQAPGFIKGVINLRGQIVAVVDLARQFELSLEEKISDKTRIIVVVVGKKIFGLIVDEVFEVIKMPQGAIGLTPEIIQTEVRKDYLKGVGRLPADSLARKDRLIILLDLEKIASGGN